MKFSTRELNSIKNALEVAADQFNKDVETATHAGQPRVAQQFNLQRENAIKLIERIELEG